VCVCVCVCVNEGVLCLNGQAIKQKMTGEVIDTGED